MNIRQWYMENYPNDDLGREINQGATFEGLFYCLDAYKSVYEYIGVGDSVIRERLFYQLSRIMKVSYGYIYEQWLKAD